MNIFGLKPGRASLAQVVLAATLMLSSGSLALATTNTKDLDPVPHYRRAVALIDAKRYNEAITELKIALQCNPSFFEAWEKLAVSYQLTEQNGKAIAEYRRLLEFKPDFVEAHVNLGSLLHENHEDAEATDEFRRAIELSYYSLPAHYNLGNLLASSGHLQEALREYQTCLKLTQEETSESGRIHNNIGVLYQRRNYLEEAEDEFLKALTADPGNRTFEGNLDIVRHQLKRKEVEADGDDAPDATMPRELDARRVKEAHSGAKAAEDDDVVAGNAKAEKPVAVQASKPVTVPVAQVNKPQAPEEIGLQATQGKLNGVAKADPVAPVQASAPPVEASQAPAPIASTIAPPVTQAQAPAPIASVTPQPITQAPAPIASLTSPPSVPTPIAPTASAQIAPSFAAPAVVAPIPGSSLSAVPVPAPAIAPTSAINTAPMPALPTEQNLVPQALATDNANPATAADAPLSGPAQGSVKGLPGIDPSAYAPPQPQDLQNKSAASPVANGLSKDDLEQDDMDVPVQSATKSVTPNTKDAWY